MAWRQIVFPDTIFKTTNNDSYQGTIVDSGCCENVYVNRQGDEQNIAFINQYLTGDLQDSQYIPTTETEIYRKGIYSITVVRNGSGPGYEVDWRFKIDNQQDKIFFGMGGNGSHRTKFKIALAINEAEQKGAFILGELSVDNYVSSVGKVDSSLDTNHTATNLYNWLLQAEPILSYTANGGGATHIAKRTGQLKDLSSYTSDILIVSGGGGGGLIVGETAYAGKEAGGISGSGDNSADQSTGNAFGLGESGTNLSGGGSGLYGGYKGTSSKSGGAGSGYIGNSLLSNKKMVGYNVPTSSATGTKTESVEVYDSNYVANKPKAGNGHVRIKFLRDSN